MVKNYSEKNKRAKMALLEINFDKSALYCRGAVFFSIIIMFGLKEAPPLEREPFSKTALQESQFPPKN